jgi:hypothetical protein
MALLAGTGTEHSYRACTDEYCERFPCRVYREGHRDGFDEGRAVGEVAGYASGFEDGLASCPGPHGGG